jgi:phospholipase C
VNFRYLLALILGTAFAAPAWTQQMPPSNHVVIITEENHSFEQVIGNPNMPYFNRLAQQYGLALQYYATTHNSLTALIWLTAGALVTTNDDTRQTFNVDNIVRHILAHGKTWKSYAEDLPYVGYDGFNVGEYVKRHTGGETSLHPSRSGVPDQRRFCAGWGGIR